MEAAKKVLISILFIMISCLTVQAQRITILNGNDSSKFVPVDFNLRHSVSEMIYLQPQISASGLITKIGFYKVKGLTYPPVDSVKIYLKLTSNITFNSGLIDTSGYTRVYTGDFPNNPISGWVEITLDTPFFYDNVSNLQVMFFRNFGVWNAGVTGNLPFYRLGTNLNRNATRSLSSFFPFTSTSTLIPSTVLPNLALQFGAISGTAKTINLDSNAFYPNPVQNYLNLPAENPYSYFTISDLTGKIIIQKTISSQRLDLSALKAGTYILSLYQKGKFQYLKVIKE